MRGGNYNNNTNAGVFNRNNNNGNSNNNNSARVVGFGLQINKIYSSISLIKFKDFIHMVYCRDLIPF